MHDNMGELPVLLCCLWAGTLLGIIYEVLRLFRRSGRKAAEIAADLLFSVCFFVVVSAVLLFADSGRLRPQYMLAILAALIVWVYFPGRLVRSMVLHLENRNKWR
ncbi:MAG: spore cortex biosynthesis protein YabQ [Clostridia bacterium]|nr:spore cortex biosynthesis protein YabQ [Clostridia bacterium]